jgi:hypothetical protein
MTGKKDANMCFFMRIRVASQKNESAVDRHVLGRIEDRGIVHSMPIRLLAKWSGARYPLTVDPRGFPTHLPEFQRGAVFREVDSPGRVRVWQATG